MHWKVVRDALYRPLYEQVGLEGIKEAGFVARAARARACCGLLLNSTGLWPLGVLDPSSGLFLVLYLVLCTFVPGIRARKGAALGPWPTKTGQQGEDLLPRIGFRMLLGPIF